MSKYIVTLAPGEVIHDGMTKDIKCPCDCYGVTDIILNNAEGDVVGTFSLCDATGKTTSDVGNVWSAGHYIRVRFDLSTMKAQVLNGASSKHADQHAANGTDPITPEMIGAPPLNHTHAASAIKAGIFAGEVAASGQTPGSYLIRNSKIAPLTDIPETPGVDGEICWLYE